MKKSSKQAFVKVEVRDENNKIISSQVEVKSGSTKIAPGKTESKEKIKPTVSVISSVVQIKSNDDKKEEVVEAVEVDNNNIDKPEYDFLHRQPSEVVDETYKVVMNLYINFI